LERFVSLPPSDHEKKHSLEQLRAMDDGMAIGVRLVDTFPLGVDTPADLARARSVLSGAAQQ
jgi:3-deoxy-manno-octulosonate cytidylyltransferase (CMP-KDO synthetase)